MIEFIMGIVTFYLTVGAIISAYVMKHFKKSKIKLKKHEWILLAIELTLLWLLALINCIIELWRDKNGKD